jgi:hypothetical protein
LKACRILDIFQQKKAILRQIQFQLCKQNHLCEVPELKQQFVKYIPLLLVRVLVEGS